MPASASPPPSPPVRTPGQQPSHPASATNRSRTPPQNDRFALYSPRNPDRRWIRANAADSRAVLDGVEVAAGGASHATADVAVEGDPVLAVEAKGRQVLGLDAPSVRGPARGERAAADVVEEAGAGDAEAAGGLGSTHGATSQRSLSGARGFAVEAQGLEVMEAVAPTVRGAERSERAMVDEVAHPSPRDAQQAGGLGGGEPFGVRRGGLVGASPSLRSARGTRRRGWRGGSCRRSDRGRRSAASTSNGRGGGERWWGWRNRRMLAELATPLYRIVCSRCHAISAR